MQIFYLESISYFFGVRELIAAPPLCNRDLLLLAVIYPSNCQAKKKKNISD